MNIPNGEHLRRYKPESETEYQNTEGWFPPPLSEPIDKDSQSEAMHAIHKLHAQLGEQDDLLSELESHVYDLTERLSIAGGRVNKVTTGFIKNIARLTHERHYDPMTNLLQEIRYEESIMPKLPSLMSEAVDNTYSLIFMDANDFKRINDEESYEVGDDAIKFIARTIHDEIRQGVDFGIRAHNAGDEFVVLLSGDKTMAEAVIQRIRDSLLQGKLYGGKPLSLSYGIALLTGPTYDEYKAARINAEEQLKEAKKNKPS